MLAALDAGAEDIEDQGDTWQVTTPPTELHAVRTALEEAGIAVTAATSRCCRPRRSRSTTQASAKSVLRVIDALEEHDDVAERLRQLRHPRRRPRGGHGLMA